MDYNLERSSVVTLYSGPDKFNLLVPDVLLSKFHLVSVVNALGCDGVISSNCSDVKFDLLSSVRIVPDLFDYRYVNNLGFSSYLSSVTCQSAFESAKEFFRMDHEANKSVKRAYLYKRVSGSVITCFVLDYIFIIEGGEISTLNCYENK